MKNRLHINELVIEITRKCNMKCLHCLRGDAENVVIDIDHVEKLFKQVGSVDVLTITGGEPSLHPEIIDQIVELSKKHEVEIYSFYMVTNAKKVTNEFLHAIINLYSVCTNMEEELGYLAISNDDFHDEVTAENIKKLEIFKFTHYKGKFDVDALINEGRSIDNYCTGRELELREYIIEGTRIDEGEVYLNCLGDILPDCNLSYESQGNKDLILGNIQDKNFNLLKEIENYNTILKSLEERTIDGISCRELAA